MGVRERLTADGFVIDGLPDKARQLAGEALRAEIDGMPRTLNYVTGPSRTADVEQTIQMGAHGPRKLHVVLIGT